MDTSNYEEHREEKDIGEEEHREEKDIGEEEHTEEKKAERKDGGGDMESVLAFTSFEGSNKEETRRSLTPTVNGQEQRFANHGSRAEFGPWTISCCPVTTIGKSNPKSCCVTQQHSLT